MQFKLSFILVFLFANNGAFSQWISLNSPTAVQLSGVSFTSEDIGYVGGNNGEVYKTIDGGNNWETQNTGIKANIFAMHFTNDSTGYACIGAGTGAILKTIDGGQNWTVKATSVSPYLIDIFFVDENIGYCVGYNGAILKTTNSGENWTTQVSGTTENLRGVHFIDAETGYIVAQQKEILKTTDGGKNWTSYGSGTNMFLLSIFFVNEKIGYTAGVNGTIMKTINGGLTWKTQKSNTTESFQSIYFKNENIGYIVGGKGLVCATANGGTTWKSNFTGNFSGNYGWYGITFNNNIGYTVGYEGNIAKLLCTEILGIDTQTACNSYTWIDGKTYTSSDSTATHTIINAAGCDSIVMLKLTINPFNIAVNQQGENLSADQTGASYQWINCADKKPIKSATNQTFTASKNGQYAVIITSNECSDTSTCYTVSGLGIYKNDFGKSLFLYPNPTNGNFSIDLGEKYNNVLITITDLNGKEIFLNNYRESQFLNINVEKPAGVYFLKIDSGDKKAVVRLLLE